MCIRINSRLSLNESLYLRKSSHADTMHLESDDGWWPVCEVDYSSYVVIPGQESIKPLGCSVTAMPRELEHTTLPSDPLIPLTPRFINKQSLLMPWYIIILYQTLLEDYDRLTHKEARCLIGVVGLNVIECGLRIITAPGKFNDSFKMLAMQALHFTLVLKWRTKVQH